MKLMQLLLQANLIFIFFSKMLSLYWSHYSATRSLLVSGYFHLWQQYGKMWSICTSILKVLLHPNYAQLKYWSTFIYWLDRWTGTADHFHDMTVGFTPSSQPAIITSADMALWRERCVDGMGRGSSVVISLDASVCHSCCLTDWL